MTDVLNALAVLAAVAFVPALVVLGIDTIRECKAWTPPTADPAPGWRIVPARPYDWSAER